jgi:hypothetical protein
VMGVGHVSVGSIRRCTNFRVFFPPREMGGYCLYEEYERTCGKS